MDKYVVSRETAVRLRSAGFPQGDTYCAWKPDKSLVFAADTYDIDDIWDSQSWAAAPTLQEIAAHMPSISSGEDEDDGMAGFAIIAADDHDQRIYLANYSMADGYVLMKNNKRLQAESTEMCEALASLWLMTLEELIQEDKKK